MCSKLTVTTSERGQCRLYFYQYLEPSSVNDFKFGGDVSNE